MGKVNRVNKITLHVLFILLMGILSIAGTVCTAHAVNYTIRWGTDGSNGIGGSITINPPGANNSFTINSGDVVNNIQQNTVIEITYDAGYTIKANDIQRLGGTSYVCTTSEDRCKLNQNTNPATITIANLSSNDKTIEIKFTAPAVTAGSVYTKWGTNGTNGNGGTITSPGRAVTNGANVSPAFGANDTATFTLVPDTGYAVDTVERREGGNGNNNWQSLTVTNNQVSFDINGKAWGLRCTFKDAPLASQSFIAYYGTNAFDLTDANKPDWKGGGIKHVVIGNDRTLGTNAYKTSEYNNNGSKTFQISTNTGYDIASIRYHKATWSNPRTVTLDGASDWVTISADTNGQFTIDVAGDSYFIEVKFKPQGAKGGNVGAWYGTTNNDKFDSPDPNGSGGEVWKLGIINSKLVNKVADGYSTNSNESTQFEVRPANGFKIDWIRVGTGANPTSWSEVAVTDPQTTKVSFNIDIKDGNQYVIWVHFTSTAASSFTVTGSVDRVNSPADCLFATDEEMIFPISKIVNKDGTGTFTFSTSTSCMVDTVNFNAAGATTDGISGYSYTTPQITANRSFVVRFKKLGYKIEVIRDDTSPSGCGEINDQGTFVDVPKGESKTFTITTTSGVCVATHVWVTDTNKGYVDADVAPLNPPSYTFTNVQANGKIKVKFSAIVPTTSDAYCQIPPFVSGQTSLAPNVLIIFDNSGSMGGTDGDGYAYYKTKTYTCTKDHLNAGQCSKFYGYFDPDTMYKTLGTSGSDANTYIVSNETLDLSADNRRSGNYLNFRNMMKVDVVRKVLIGGKVVDRSATDIYLVTDNGKKVYYGKSLPTGIIHRLAGKVRFGIMVFNDPAEGGHLVAQLGSSQADLVTAIEGPSTNPKTMTPIAETLYEAIRYFQAKKSAYNDKVDYGTMDPIQNSCQKHFILLLTDGEPNSSNNLPGYATHPTMNGYTDDVFKVNEWEDRIPEKDRASNSDSQVCTYEDGTTVTVNYGSSTNSEKVEAVAFYAHNTDLRSSTFENNLPGNQYITLFPIYAFGNGSGTKTLQMAAKYGGYVNKNGKSPSTWESPDNLNEWEAKGHDCIADNYFQAEDGQALEDNLTLTMSTILAKVASGTAASILSNSEGSGANMLQAVFFPNRIFENSTEVNWIGEMQNLWYYVDPFIGNSSVREDTGYVSGTHSLDLRNDRIANFFFDSKETNTLVNLTSDSNGDGIGDTFIKTVKTDEVNSLWRAGKLLWARSPETRTIHTSINGTSLLASSETPPKGGFYAPPSDATSDTRPGLLQPYLQAANNDSNIEARKIIKYIRGTDQTNYRNRKVSLVKAENADLLEWKLGDIISSTPRIQSTSRINSYSVGPPSGYGDVSYFKFINSDNYKKRGMVYVGANDGMMHAFKLGTLTVSGSTIGGDVKATLTGDNLGEEQWAYIPRNALPYLKYYTEKDTYKHLYYVDGQTVLADVATGSCGVGDYSDCAKDFTNGTNWKTVLIGSMGLGGASKVKATAACVDGVDGTCVKTPIFDPEDGTNSTGLGYSSYFALDVTNQYFNTDGTLANQPTLKWEFSHPDLGYSTSGAAIVRIKAKTDGIPDNNKNGKWFAVMASGPTGPIDTTNHRFMGRSNQRLKLFVIDLGATAPLVLNTSYWIIDTEIPYAYAGSILPSVIDADRWNNLADGNYQDDALYIGYTKANTETLTATTTWTDGGVLRVLTKEDSNPANWVVSKVIDGIGPVTTGINRLQDRKSKKLWLYFGTGRYYYTDDDTTSRRYIMGVQDRCYTFHNTIDKNCNTSTVAGDNPESTGKGGVLSLSDLANNTNSCSDMSGKKGWYFTLRPDDYSTFMGAERVITDAVPMSSGMVLYTTFMPTTDVCKFGGTSFMYSVKYDTGCEPLCSGLGDTKVMIQMSTGSFEQMNLKDIFACREVTGEIHSPPPWVAPPDFGDVPSPPPGPNQPSPPMVGKPPADPPSFIPAFLNPPLKKIMHIQER